MNIFLTGSTGFIGKYLLKEILASGNNIKLAIRQGSTAFTTPWDIFIAVGMRNNSNVKTFIEVPKTIGKLTSGS